MDEAWGIGKDGNLLFHISPDLVRFKSLTVGNTVLMGRATFESLPGRRPLRDRVNAVLSRSADFHPEGVVTLRSEAEALEFAENAQGEVFVIGGAAVYKLFYPRCEKIYVTKVFAGREADSFFPNLDQDSRFAVTERSEILAFGELKYQYLLYRQK